MSSNSEKLTIENAAEIIRGLQSEEYIVEYTDNTHLASGRWQKLLRIKLSKSPGNQDIDATPFYTFYTLVAAAGDETSTEPHGDVDVLNDALAQVLVRTGILRPTLSPEGIEDVFQLTQRTAVVLVPDTNALSTGTLHWLLRVLAKTQIWLLPGVISLTQLQQRDVVLRGMVGRKRPHNLRQAIRSRTLINAAFGLLERCRERYQVLEVDPQLLRYVRPAGRGSGDPDEGDVLEDRLLIEAIHAVFRTTRSRTEMRVLTSDVMLARILHIEGLSTLFLQTPILPADPIPCVFYEPLAHAFFGAPLIHLLWDLAHTFATIRLQDAMGQEVLQLEAYWPGKTAMEWSQEYLMVSWPVAEAPERHTEIPAFPSYTAGHYSTAVLPEASFVQVLRLGGALLEDSGTLENLLSRIAENVRPTTRIARMAIELLLRAGFARVAGEFLFATEALNALDHALAMGNLDAANHLWTQFLPYNTLLSVLREQGELARDALVTVLEPVLDNRPSNDACERFSRVPVYLGQAWTDGELLRDGSARPQDEVVIEHFSHNFEEKARDGLCPVGELLPALCLSLRISPWAVSGQIQRLVQDNRFPNLSFQSAAGRRIATKDHIVVGRLAGLRTVPIPMDRIEIGDRPVFTVSRRVS